MGLWKFKVHLEETGRVIIFINMILLKSLLSETDIGGRNVQVYLDLDGVMVDLDSGFKEVSGGILPSELTDKKCNGDRREAKKLFWKLIGTNGADFWANLKPMPDAMVLWNFFKKYHPIILTAGKGTEILQGKTQWCHKHLGSNINPILAVSGIKKSEYITNDPNTVHVLIDDTQKNIESWNSPSEHRIAISHKNAAESIRKFSELYLKPTTTT